MYATTHRHPARRIIFAAAFILVAAGIAVVGPTATFHWLSPATTGEDARLAALLQIAPGQTVADIGAGRGALSMSIARRLQPGGRLYATEIEAGLRKDISDRAVREQISNVVVIEAGATSTGLPDACCDAIFMRLVYHHLADTARFNQSLRRAVRPGARVAIIDFEPGAFWLLRRRPPGASADREGHGVSARVVAEELSRVGFRVERTIANWGGRTFLVLVRAPM